MRPAPGRTCLSFVYLRRLLVCVDHHDHLPFVCVIRVRDGLLEVCVRVPLVRPVCDTRYATFERLRTDTVAISGITFTLLTVVITIFVIVTILATVSDICPLWFRNYLIDSRFQNFFISHVSRVC